MQHIGEVSRNLPEASERLVSLTLVEDESSGGGQVRLVEAAQQHERSTHPERVARVGGLVGAALEAADLTTQTPVHQCIHLTSVEEKGTEGGRGLAHQLQ